MRLYMLLSRVGLKKKRLWPWFAPPAAGAPVKYAGWVWSPEKEEWVETPMEPVSVDVRVPSYPKPELPPRPAVPTWLPGWTWTGRDGEWVESPLTPQEISEGFERGPKPEWPPGPARPDKVKGWAWSYTTEEWVATIIVGKKVEFEPVTPLPPDIDVEKMYAAAAYDVDVKAVIESLKIGMIPHGVDFRVHLTNLVLMLEKSGYTRAAADKIMNQYEKLTWGLSEVQRTEVWRHATKSIFDCWRRTHLVGTAKAQLCWAEYVRHGSEYIGARAGPGMAIPILILILALTGALIGYVLHRTITAEETEGAIPETPGTYLMRYDHYLYSKMIAISPKGKPYYSACDDIGMSYIRHRRPRARAGIDIIDFPGGFVEEGREGIYFVKYTWQYWMLVYVGMLTSIGKNFYALREGEYDPQAAGKSPFQLLESEWCIGFRHYL